MAIFLCMSLEKNDQIKWTDITKLKPNPKNTNKHSKDQIERLAKIISYQGFRSPIVVSNLSGLVVAGHARLDAAKELGLTNVPVSFQDFTDLDQEFAHLNADNAIASWAEINLDEIRNFDFGLDFDVEFLGLKNFVFNKDLDLSDLDEKEDKEKKQSYKLEIEFPNEKEMTKKYNELMSDGFLVKAIF